MEQFRFLNSGVRNSKVCRLALLFTYCVALGKSLKLSDACMKLSKIACVKFRAHGEERSVSVGCGGD